MTGTSNMPFPSQQNGNNSEQETAGGMISTIIRIRTIVLVALGVSLLLQTAAVSTPGLYIVSSPTFRHQEGFFFYVFCDKTDEKGTCKTESYSDNYLDAMERASKTDKINLRKYIGFLSVSLPVPLSLLFFFFCLSISLSLCLSLSLFYVFVSLSLSACLSVCLSLSPFVLRLSFLVFKQKLTSPSSNTTTSGILSDKSILYIHLWPAGAISNLYDDVCKQTTMQILVTKLSGQSVINYSIIFFEMKKEKSRLNPEK